MDGSGRLAPHEGTGPVASPAKIFHLEIVKVAKDGRRRRRLTRIPVAVHEDRAQGDGPWFLSPLAKGRYALTTHYDAWSFMSPVTIDKARRRVVVEERS